MQLILSSEIKDTHVAKCAKTNVLSQTNLNTALENQFHEHILKAAGKVIEVCKPALKGEAIQLAGSVLLVNPPDFRTAGVNLVVDLSLHLLSSSQLFFLLVMSFTNYLLVYNFGVSYNAVRVAIFA